MDPSVAVAVAVAVAMAMAHPECVGKQPVFLACVTPFRKSKDHRRRSGAQTLEFPTMERQRLYITVERHASLDL